MIIVIGELPKRSHNGRLRIGTGIGTGGRERGGFLVNVGQGDCRAILRLVPYLLFEGPVKLGKYFLKGSRLRDAGDNLRELLLGRHASSLLHIGEGGTPRECPRCQRRNGFLIFTGAVATEETPDHRALREERVDSLLKGVDEGRL